MLTVVRQQRGKSDAATLQRKDGEGEAEVGRDISLQRRPQVDLFEVE